MVRIEPLQLNEQSPIRARPLGFLLSTSKLRDHQYFGFVVVSVLTIFLRFPLARFLERAACVR